MTPRKPLTPRPTRVDTASRAVVGRYPKAIERPSIPTWSTPGRGGKGESVNSGNLRPSRLSPQFGMQS